MNVLVLTPDTDIDRRIILQANVLTELGHCVTIIGVPYKGDNFLSGNINENIQIKRIDINDISYDNLLIKTYKKFHEKVSSINHNKNKMLIYYHDKGSIHPEGSKFYKFARLLNNRFVALNIRIINIISTIAIVLLQRSFNLIYKAVLYFVRLFKINFFPSFDNAFINAGINEDADIVIANDLPTLKAASVIAKEKSIPLIYDAHENYTEQCTLMKKHSKQLEEIEAEILPDVDFWIVPNELLGNCMIEKYSNKYNKKISEPLVIQNAINKWDEYDDYKNQDLIRKKLGIGEDKKILLFQGGFLAKRNLENLVKSMRYVTNKSVVLVMLGYGSYGDVLKGIVKRNKLDNKVLFMNAVSQQELLRYTCSANVGVIPYPAVDKNTYYCSPNKLYEYIQARLPMLANDLPFIKKILEDNKIGQVENFSSPKTIAKAIDGIFGDEMGIKMYKSNLNVLSDSICWEVEKQKLINKYCEHIEEFSKFEDVSII